MGCLIRVCSDFDLPHCTKALKKASVRQYNFQVSYSPFRTPSNLASMSAAGGDDQRPDPVRAGVRAARVVPLLHQPQPRLPRHQRLGQLHHLSRAGQEIQKICLANICVCMWVSILPSAYLIYIFVHLLHRYIIYVTYNVTIFIELWSQM